MPAASAAAMVTFMAALYARPVSAVQAPRRSRPRGCDRLSFEAVPEAASSPQPSPATHGAACYRAEICNRRIPGRAPCTRHDGSQSVRNLITDVPGINVGHAAGSAARLRRDRHRVRTRPPSPRSTCAAADRARAKPRCSIRRRRWRASTPSRLSGGSAFGLDAASGRAGVAEGTGPRLRRGHARGCRSCRPRSCSIS